MSDMSNSGTGKVLSLEQKLEVCQQVGSGESFRKNAENFGLGVSTITDIYQSRRYRSNFNFEKIDGKSVKKRALLSARNVEKCRVHAERSRTVVYR
ncbi:hypothetical protein T01_12247 [Trichinella spiralis]|uniref:Uncharacterized protein n=1 Tax=Trichinella spiralis TaxID=6334 RepID=A0A0V1AWA5_TRISP|nr:hypothetical protein T01_12247 [Trichinella spiralis]